MEFEGSDLEAVVAGVGGTGEGRFNPEQLEAALAASRARGLLRDVAVHRLARFPGQPSAFLVSLQASEHVTVCSPPVQWQELEPPVGLTGACALRYVLIQVRETAEQLRISYATDAWQKVAVELGEVKKIIACAVASGGLEG
ncbi:hypothetical protein ABZ545_09630 [Streptomyces abikoensis]|uniref:Uncharacterized protein n=1 Tax=Streptomyces abikoensis TaxID=97398 RepID=A0ABW7TB26_9ACTN